MAKHPFFTEARFGVIFKHTFFLALCGISVIFYRERTLHYDPAFFVWGIINEQDFFIALGRYGAWIGQALPLLLIKAGSEIKTVLIAFSLSFALFYYVLYLVIEYLLRDKRLTWVLVLSLCLTFRQTFYYTTAEVYHGMALSILGWALLKKALDSKGLPRIIFWVSVLFITFSLPYFHQINLILWFFLVGAEYMDRRNWKDFRIPAMLGFILLWFVARIKLFSSSSYEKAKLLTVDDHLYALSHFFELPSFKYLADWIFPHISLALIFFALCLVYLVIKEKKIAALYTLGFFLAFVVLIVNTNFRGESVIMYENYYSLFGIFFSVAFALAIEGKNLGKFATLVVVILSIHSVIAIVESVDMYQYRTKLLQRLTTFAATAPTNKFILSAENFPEKYGRIPWAFPFETALCSAIDGNRGNSSFFISNDPELYGPNAENAPDFIGVPWEPEWFNADGIARRGIELRNTPYKIANTAREEPFGVEEFETFSKNFSLIPNRRRIKFDDEDIIVWGTYIYNESGQTLHSALAGPNPTFIGYRIFLNGAVVGTKKMPLETDIYPGQEFTSGVIIEKPKGIKDGSLKFGLYTEGFGWWATSDPVRMLVD